MAMSDERGPAQHPADRTPLRILALDGGGILGAFTAGVLDGLMIRADRDERKEASSQGRAPRPVRLIDHVDLITGTSTGGILAIALAMGSSPEQVCSFYRDHGPKIFPEDPLRTRTLWHLLRYKYKPGSLRSAIESVVGERPLDEAGCGLVLPAVDVDNGAIRMFKTDHHDDTRWVTPDVPAVEAALATSAAPSYFPAHTIPGGVTYIDGGLWANNPAMVGVTEAVAYLKSGLDRVRLLSIGTTKVPYHLSRSRRVGGMLRWAKPAIDALMRFQVEAAHSMAKSLVEQGGGRYLRIDPTTPEGIFTMDNAGMVERLIGMGREQGQYASHYDFFREYFLDGPLATLHRRPEPPRVAAAPDPP
jgi:patatin-like phospholipase/acyl hydrolase